MDYFCFSFLANDSLSFSNTINYLALNLTSAEAAKYSPFMCLILKHRVYDVPFNCIEDHSTIHRHFFRKVLGEDFQYTCYVRPEKYYDKLFPARDKSRRDADLKTLKHFKNITIYSNNNSTAKSTVMYYKELVLFGYTISMDEYKSRNLDYASKLCLYDSVYFKDTFDSLTDYVSFMARLKKERHD